MTACAAAENEAVEVPKPFVLELDIDSTPLSVDGVPEVVSYADVLERATASVVAVYTAQFVTRGSRGGSGMDDLFRQFGLPVPDGEGRNGERPRERTRTGVGSGVIVSSDGIIVTNHHVITDRAGRPVDEIRVQLPDGSEFAATVVGSDAPTDVAVLRIESESPLPAITIADSELLRVGDVVFAIGNPLEVGMTATMGIVSATGRTSLGILGQGGYENFIQTDAAINLGNSGGALVDAKGRLIGINTAIFSRSGGNIGIGFAIPGNMVVQIMRSLLETGNVQRGLLGLRPRNLNRDLVEAFGLPGTTGALVEEVLDASPAKEAGIQHGDVIIAIDEREITSAEQLRLTVSSIRPGTEVQVAVIRDGETRLIPVVLGSLDVASGGPVAQPPVEVLEGLRLRSLSSELRSGFSIPEEVNGVLVERAATDSPYGGDLRVGTVIVEVNGQRVESREAVAEALRPGMNRLYVWLDDRFNFVTIRR